ncbi:MAG: PAS domain-containing hybrid sensor histidine kinase/response regulator [Thermodesulfobacteriota bacterium]
MMKKNEGNSDALREKALKILEKKGVQDESLYSASLEDLIQELSIYQIELEHQNDELKKTQAELEASRNRLFDLYHNAPSGYVTINDDYVVEEINLTACKMLGMPQYNSVVGQRFTRFIRPEDQDAYYFHFKKCLKEQSPQLCELRLIAKDRRSFLVVRLESVKDTAASDNDRKKIRSSIIDITRAKEAEAVASENQRRFVETVDLLPDAVFETDRALNIIYANRAMTQLFDFSAEDIERGIKCLSLFYPDDVDAARQRIESIYSGGVFAPAEYRFVKKDGTVIDALFNDSAIIKNGDFSGLRVSITDLSELKRLRRAAERAEKIESIGMLAGNIAHEFNNLFMVLYGNLSMAKEELSPDHGAYEWVAAAEQSISTARELSGRLLTFSRGGDPLIRCIDPGDMVAEAIDAAIGDGRVEVIMNGGQKSWPVYADADQLRQVVFQLAANAAQAMPAGGRLWVSLENLRVSGDAASVVPSGYYVRMVFTDEGPGISGPDLDRVFDPYFTTKQGAVGLGLSIAHSIITRHAGHIDVRSKPGEGCEFIVYLPSGPLFPENAAAAADAGGAENNSGQTGCRMLVMDDDSSVQRVSKKMFETQGCSVCLANDGEQAIAIYREAFENGTGFDAVILDLTVPAGMGGKEAVKHIKAINPASKVIVSSGYTADPVLADYRAYGFDDAIEKPYQLANLKALLARINDAKSQ